MDRVQLVHISRGGCTYLLYLAAMKMVFGLLSQQQTDTQERMEDRQLELVTSKEEGGERAPRETHNSRITLVQLLMGSHMV